MATVNFALDTNFKSSRADKIKRIQIHVAEAQGLSLKGSANSRAAYVTVESPGFGTLHQTSSVGKGKKLVWHENTRIVELKPTAPIKFTVKRQGIWPMTHHVLGSTDTYDLNRLIEMQGKNDRETCVSLSLNQGSDAKTKPSTIVVNIRDLDTREEIQQVRDYAAYAAASSKRKGKERETDFSDSTSEESYSPNSAGLLDSPMMTGTSSTFSSFSPSSSPSTSPSIRHYSPPVTTGAVAAAASVMSTAVGSPNTTPATSSPHVHESIIN